MIGIRGVRQRVGDVETRLDGVGAIFTVARDEAHGGRNTGGVDSLHLVGVLENAAELPRKEVEFVLVELEMRERCDGRDLRARQWRGHGKC